MHPQGSNEPQVAGTLTRSVGVFGATMMGLGSIVGTGVFVSIGIATEIAGPAIVLAIPLAAIVATCNGLSSAQLAANHPVSGGTYEYAHRWLRPSVGYLAGWLFLCAKTASAATAALGFAGYLLNLLQIDSPSLLVPVAIVTVALLSLLVLAGIRRSNAANIVILSVTLFALGLFIAIGIPVAWPSYSQHLTAMIGPAQYDRAALARFLEATALMFVAYTGYGRIATLGEEVREPRRSIPRAIILTLVISMLLYVGVGLVTGMTLGTQAEPLDAAQRTAPLEWIARKLELPIVARIVAVGAMTAMVSVLLNLILGLSRVVLAMSRRGDLPAGFARVNAAGDTPSAAVIAVGVAIGLLALSGSVKATWSFSAFTVLIYYAVTNLAAIRLRADERLYPRFVPWCGLISCAFLAAWIQPTIWLAGAALVAVGFALRAAVRLFGAR